MTDDQYIEIGMTAVALAGGVSFESDVGYILGLHSHKLPVSKDIAFEALKAMGWRVEERDGSVWASKNTP